MQKVKLTLIAAALILGVGGALATHASTHRTAVASGTNLYWFDPSGATFYEQTDKADEMSLSGCPDENPFIECRRGYLESQLNNSTDPTQGVKTADVNSPSDVIHEQLD